MVLVRFVRPTRLRSTIRFSLLLLLVFLDTPGDAHDPGLSSVILRSEGGQLTAVLGFHGKDLESLVAFDVNGDGAIAKDEFAVARPQLEALAASWAEISVVKQPLHSTKADASMAENGDVFLRVSYPSAPGSKVRVRSLWLTRLPAGHRQYAELQNDGGKSTASKMLSAGDDTFDVDLETALAKPSRAATFWQFIVLGVEHIWTGYDHVCFLLALMIVGGTFRSVVAIITSFTVAHSISLALATFNLVQLSSSIVEPLIAVTIIYVGSSRVDLQACKLEYSIVSPK